MLAFNPAVKLILSDVDETLADLYLDAVPEMISALNKLLKGGEHLFLISGQGFDSINERIVSKLEPEFRHLVLVAHCSGAEVLGYTKEGERREQAFYSLYDQNMSEKQKVDLRTCSKILLAEFKLEALPAMPLTRFKELAGTDPARIMLQDRGPQITYEMPNSYELTNEKGELYDLRDQVIARATELFTQYQVPVCAAKGGMFAVDFRLAGVSKTLAVKYIFENDMRIHGYDLGLTPGNEVKEIEIWGDRYSEKAGSDFYMCYAVPKEVRAIDFRHEDPESFPPGYNIIVWDGQKQLQEGTLEYLQAAGL